MKKATLLACAFALMSSSALVAQEQAVTYVPDATQGYLINKMSNNWFITVEGGVNMNFNQFDSERKLMDRFAPAASIYLGKWFSPVIALRGGGSWINSKGLTDNSHAHGLYLGETVKGYDKQRLNLAGIATDAMINLTNWWCGYKPNRCYNAIAYLGAGLYWAYQPAYTDAGARDGWEKVAGAHEFVPRAGLINKFRLSNHVDLFLDLRYTGHTSYLTGNDYGENFSAFLGLNFNLGKTTWNAPIVPICPEPENCDALRARLSAADARIADLEAQLRDCLNRPVQTVVEKDDAPLATIYYPIGVSRLTREDKNVLQAIAYVMKDNPNTKYTLTGWADNYTGSEQVNIRLRHARANGVQKELVKNGVAESQLNVTINNGSLCDLGEKFVSLDRAVTIEEAK